MESTIYTVAGKEFELKHYGVRGMKWGRRKARPQSTGTGRRGGQAATDSTQSEAARKEARRVKAKKAAKITAAYGAIAVASVIAGYGARTVVSARQSMSTKMYKQTLALIDQMNKHL